MIARVAWCAAVLAGCASAQKLTLREVVASVQRHYPPLLAALAETEVAEGEALAAEGRFDPILRTRIDTDSFGYYANRRADVWLEQPLAAQGMSLYSGYRVGLGEFAEYDGKLDTRSLGEMRAGIRLPLLRDRAIDSRRGELTKARIGRKLASLGADQQKLVVLQSAIQRYWIWVANGRRLAISREVLAIAEARQQLLEEGVREGHLAHIDALDNKRAILQRQSQLIEAERSLQQAAIELSLFYRGPSMQPIVPLLEQVPVEFPAARPLAAQQIREDQQLALQRRPEVERFSAQRDQIDVDRRLAANAGKPSIELNAGFTSDRGTDPRVRRGPEELRAGIAFELPFRNRTARGREAAAEAKIRQLDLRAAFQRDQIQAEVRDAASAVQAAQNRLAILAGEVDVSRELEQAERTRFELGEGTLFVLNLREQATADAAIRRALAEADLQRALASYDYATGALLQ
jgi:cobalt-zinc-cadmium efflux system outer membrane protein